MLRLAITGGLASGKSTVAGLLRARGIPVVDADALGHELLHGEAQAEVVAVFGPDIVENGRISPARLAARVFAPGGEAELARLNRILHPRILEEAARRLDEYEKQGREAAGVEAALLIEAGLLAGFDQVVLVTAPPAVRIERFVRRTGADEAQARARLAQQWPDEQKRPQAHFVIENNGTLAELGARVDAMLRQMRKETAAS
ncbi:MAG TPA: dephospho-CoA kinase [Terriglobales bacterium]|nr:dephospho-CoA kinase [Terriglobales bacterium]